MDDSQQKTAFAEALLRNPDDPFKAAFSVIADTGKAIIAATQWLKDSFVASEKLRLLKENGDRYFLPTKEEQAREIYKIAKQDTADMETRLKAHRLYAEMMEHIPKPIAGNTTNVLNQGVMIVKDHGSDDDWQEKALLSQRTLVGHATN